MNNYGNNHLETPAMSGETAGTWIGFLSNDEKDAGNSVYTGKMILFKKKSTRFSTSRRWFASRYRQGIVLFTYLPSREVFGIESFSYWQYVQDIADVPASFPISDLFVDPVRLKY